MAPKRDITNQIFGNLKAIKCTGKKEHGSYIWEFECLLCGKIVERRIGVVTSGGCISCGCWKVNNLKTKPINEKLGQIYGTNLSRIKSKKLPKNNTSGRRGVSLHKQKGKSDRWIAYIYFQGTKYYLGSFIKKEDAIKARLDAEERQYGDFLKWYRNVHNK